MKELYHLSHFEKFYLSNALTQLFLYVNNIGDKYDEQRATKKFSDKLQPR